MKEITQHIGETKGILIQTPFTFSNSNLVLSYPIEGKITYVISRMAK